MTVNSAVTLMAGFFTMLSLALGVAQIDGIENPVFMHEYWLLFTAFVGFNLFQSSLTGFCPAAMIFKAMGLGNK
jgi:hypothetical protein